jgi:hypothetical protein
MLLFCCLFNDESFNLVLFALDVTAVIIGFSYMVIFSYGQFCIVASQGQCGEKASLDLWVGRT